MPTMRTPAILSDPPIVRRENFRQDALRAWEAYQAMGAHVTAQEADAWLARLEAGENVGPPAAHG